MNVILGVDVGKSKTGIAIGEDTLASPLSVIHEKDIENLAQKVEKIARDKNAQKVIIGIPEGEIEQHAKNLGDKLVKRKIEVEFFDETLSTQDAQNKAIAAGISKKRRRELEDAFAATVMLQFFLDTESTKQKA